MTSTTRPGARAIDLLDPEAYFTAKPRLSSRHRVRDNLLGDRRFCPVIRRTKALNDFLNRDLAATARETVGRAGAHLVTRVASFMLLADSRASFEIEGERPPRNRLERWGRAVVQAGRNRLTLDEIVRLHGVLIEDSRFVHLGNALKAYSWASGITTAILCPNSLARVRPIYPI